MLFAEVAVDKRHLILRHLGELLRLAVSGPSNEVVRTHSQGEEIEFILVAALQECDVLRRTVCVSLMRLRRQDFPVSLRECVQCIRGSSFNQLLSIDLQQVGYGLTAQRFHNAVCTCDSLFCRTRDSGGTALGDDLLEIIL